MLEAPAPPAGRRRLRRRTVATVALLALAAAAWLAFDARVLSYQPIDITTIAGPAAGDPTWIEAPAYRVRGSGTSTATGPGATSTRSRTPGTAPCA